MVLSQGNLHWLQEEHLQYDLTPQSKKTDEAIASTCKKEESTEKSASSCDKDRASSAVKVVVEKCQHLFCNKKSNGAVKFSRCSKCSSAYCSRECQVKDWKLCHKLVCPQLASIRDGSVDLNQREIVGKWLIQSRLYLCPFAVHHFKQRGKGFLFVQCENTLLDLFYNAPVNSRGYPLCRRMFVHFLNEEEWQERCSQNFEFSMISNTLSNHLANTDMRRDGKVAVVVLLRCGRLLVVEMPLVPDFGICEKLGDIKGKEVSSDMLQLNLDDH